MTKFWLSQLMTSANFQIKELLFTLATNLPGLFENKFDSKSVVGLKEIKRFLWEFTGGIGKIFTTAPFQGKIKLKKEIFILFFPHIIVTLLRSLSARF